MVAHTTLQNYCENALWALVAQQEIRAILQYFFLFICQLKSGEKAVGFQSAGLSI